MRSLLKKVLETNAPLRSPRFLFPRDFSVDGFDSAPPALFPLLFMIPLLTSRSPPVRADHPFPEWLYEPFSFYSFFSVPAASSKRP